MTATCAHPCCNRKIQSDSLTKCCGRHQHSAWCQCVVCSARRAKEEPPARRCRDHIGTVLVPQTGIYQSDVNYVAVSVSRPPWERNTA